MGNDKGGKVGRPTGSKTDNVKLGISISRKNAEWLRGKKGKNVSGLIDMAIDRFRGGGVRRYVKLIVKGKEIKVFGFNPDECILPDDVQPLINLRGVDLKYATPDEFLEYYTRQYGQPVLT